MNDRKVTILMPTYNDAAYIRNALDSVLAQDYPEIELIIVDNGSTDDTKSIIRRYLSGHGKFVKFIEEPLPGQLNALWTASRLVTGDYVMLLHSDDEIIDGSLSRLVTQLEQNQSAQGLFSDLVIIDKEGRVKGAKKVLNQIDNDILTILLLRAGSNPIQDTFFVRRVFFDACVLQNYVLWNIPYYLSVKEEELSVGKLVKVAPWYKYRVYSENYITSEVGRFESANGRLRTVMELSRYLDIPFYKLQYNLLRALQKIAGFAIQPVTLTPSNYPDNAAKFVRKVLEDYYQRIPEEYRYLVDYFINRSEGKEIQYKFYSKPSYVYYGKDAKKFFVDMKEDRIPDSYLEIMDLAAEEGFSRIRTNRVELMSLVLRFLNIPASVLSE